MVRSKRKASQSPVAGAAKKLRLHRTTRDQGASDASDRDDATSDVSGRNDHTRDNSVSDDCSSNNGASSDDGTSDHEPKDDAEDIFAPNHSGPALSVALLRILRSCHSDLGPSGVDEDDCWSCSMASCTFSFKLDSLHDVAPALILDAKYWNELDWTGSDLSAQLHQYEHVFAKGHVSFLERGFGIGEDGVDWLFDDDRVERLEFACLRWRLCAVQLLHYASHFPDGANLGIARDLVLAAKECFMHLVEFSV